MGIKRKANDKVEKKTLTHLKKNGKKYVKTYIEFKVFQKIWRTIWKKARR
jgi:hypothetical protein